MSCLKITLRQPLPCCYSKWCPQILPYYIVLSFGLLLSKVISNLLSAFSLSYYYFPNSPLYWASNFFQGHISLHFSSPVIFNFLFPRFLDYVVFSSYSVFVTPNSRPSANAVNILTTASLKSLIWDIHQNRGVPFFCTRMKLNAKLVWPNSDSKGTVKQKSLKNKYVH